MKRLTWLLLALWLTPAVAWAGGGGFVNLAQTLEPLHWRWFENDDAAQPTPAAPTGQPLGAVAADQTVRLRYSVACSETRLQGSGAKCKDAILGLGYLTGAWSCQNPGDAITSQLDAGQAWNYRGGGPAPHGQLIADLLLPRSQNPGYFYSAWPTADLKLTLPVLNAGAYVPVETDFTLAPVAGAWQPNTRYVFFPERINDEPALELLDCNGAELCTTAGPSDLAAARPIRWGFGVPFSTPLDVADWNDDGKPDLIMGWLNDAPVLFLNETTFQDQEPHFAIGRVLPLEVEQTARLYRPIAVDWNQDGHLDLVAGSMRGEIRLFLNQGDDSFGPAQILALRENAGTDFREAQSLVDIADWDGDQLPDVLLLGMNGNLTFWRNPGPVGNTILQGPTEVLFNGKIMKDQVGQLSIFKVVEYNGDDRPDIFASDNFGEHWIFVNNGAANAPAFGDRVQVVIGGGEVNGYSFPDLADLDGDGKQELLLGSPTGGLRIIPDTGVPGQPEFTSASIDAIANPPALAATHGARVLWDELTAPRVGARRHDLLVGRPDGTVEVFLGIGQEDDPTFGVLVRVAAGLPADPAPELGDLDDDGVDDLVIGFRDGTVGMWKGLIGQRWRTFEPQVAVTVNGAPLNVGSAAVPRVVDWNRDGRPDLLVGSGDGRIHLFVANGGGLSAGGAVQAGGQELRLDGGASALLVDWDDDGLPDLLAASTGGQVLLAYNQGEVGTPEFGPATPLQAAGGPLDAGPGATLLAADFNPLDCAKDLVFARADGAIRYFPATVATPPAPTNLAPSGDTDDVAGVAIPVQPQLAWDPASPPAALTYRYDIELAERSDFEELLLTGASDGGAFLQDPTEGVTVPEALEAGRRYFWRVRSFDDQRRPGYWPVPAASFAVPLPAHFPVDGEFEQPEDAGEWTLGSGWASLKGLDAHLESLPIQDRQGVLRETGAGAFQLNRVFVFDQPALSPARYELHLTAGSEGDAEALQVEVAGANGWRQLGTFSGAMTAYTWPLLADDVQAGALRIRIKDPGPDVTPTVALLDYLAAVILDRLPTASAGPDQTVDEGAPVQLDGSGSRPGEEGQALTYAWTQLGGPAVQLDDAAVIRPRFNAPGVVRTTELVFQLTVTAGQLQASDQVTITVRNSVNEPPVAVAGPDQQVNEGVAAQLDGLDSSDPNGDPLTYEWTQLDGLDVVVLTFDDPTSPTPTVTAAAVGEDTTFTLLLEVGDGQASATDELLLTVLNTGTNDPPTADAGADLLVAPGAAILLDGSNSADPDGDPLTFSWSQTSGPAPADLPADLGQPTLAFTAPQLPEGVDEALLVFLLEVSDGEAAATDEVQITVRREGTEGEGEGTEGEGEGTEGEGEGTEGEGEGTEGEGEGTEGEGEGTEGEGEGEGSTGEGEGEGATGEGEGEGATGEGEGEGLIGEGEGEGEADVGDGSKSAEGCDCSVPGAQPPAAAPLLLLLGGLFLIRRRG